MERNLIQEVRRGHDHARNPQRDDVAGGEQRGRGMMPLQKLHVIGPTLRGEGPQLAGEPGVQNVLVLAHVMAAALRTHIDVLHECIFPTAILAVEHGDTMAPPQLAGDAPVLKVFHPGKVGLRPALGMELDVAGGDGLGGRPLQLVDGNEPLLGQPRLQCRVATIAMHDRVMMVLNVIEQAMLLEPRHHGLAAFLAAHAGELAIAFHDVRRLVEDVDLLQAVALAHGEVVGIMGGSDLHETGAETRIDVKIGENGNLAIHDGQHDLRAHELIFVVVFRGYGNARVAQHGFRTGGCDHDVFLAVDRLDQRVAQMPQVAVFLFVLGLIIGDGRGAMRAPVHDALAAVNQIVVIPIAEHLAHALGVIIVHGEVRIGEINGAAHAFDLLNDESAVLIGPVPARIDELLAADLATRDALGGKLLVHLGLRGDASVVRSQDPARGAAAHAVEAHEGVLDGVIHSVAHMQLARDVRRRDGHRAITDAGAATVVVALKPLVQHALLNGGGIVGFRHFFHVRRSSPVARE